MGMSETVLILAVGTAVLAILFGARLAMRAVAGGATTASRSDGAETPAGAARAPDVAGVIALPPFIFLGFLVMATVLEAVIPLPGTRMRSCAIWPAPCLRHAALS